jgi:hypothetical protein
MRLDSSGTHLARVFEHVSVLASSQRAQPNG